MNSMTGYASKSFEFEEYSMFIEIKSLNNKFLEIKCKIPPYLEPMEERLRRIIKQYVSRGKVEVIVKIVAKEEMEFKLIKGLLDRYYKLIHRIEEETRRQFQVSLTELLTLESFFDNTNEITRISIPEEEFEKIFIDTLKEFKGSRYTEGEIARKDIENYIKHITSSLKKVEEVYPSVIEKYRDQLKMKIRELIEAKVDETRLMTEVGIFANKVDISEEISRIKGHLKKMLSTIKSDGACGRELDFISQELNREINTIGAKVPDYTVSENVVYIKANLEKIKEQVRNIE